MQYQSKCRKKNGSGAPNPAVRILYSAIAKTPELSNCPRLPQAKLLKIKGN